MTKQKLEREKKEFISFVIIGVFIHIIAVYIVIIQFIPEITLAGILKAIFFGILMTIDLVAYLISMSRYAKAIKNAEEKLEDE